MAAGLGFKEFTTGDVLTAADANGYLASQVVMVFADAAARTSAIASPQEGMISYLKDTNATQYYSGSAWVTIGGAGSPLTTKGDLYTYSTTDARLAVGANDTVLTADSAEATGLKWATPASGGMTLINTGGTTLSGATTTVSTIPGTYNELIIFIDNPSGSADYSLLIRPNANSTASDYQQFVNRGTGSTNNAYVDNATSGVETTGYGMDSPANGNMIWASIPNYASTTADKVINVSSGFIQTTGAKAVCNTTCYFAQSAAITSLVFFISSGLTFSGGTVYVYGVK
jgi:hypothetical protein